MLSLNKLFRLVCGCRYNLQCMCTNSILHMHTELLVLRNSLVLFWHLVVGSRVDTADLSAGDLPGSLLQAHSLDLHPL